MADDAADPAPDDVEVDADATDATDATEEADASARVTHPGRWAAVGGVLTLAYLLWYLGDLVLLDRSPRAYVTMHELYGTLFMRIVFAVVFLGLVFHGLDGVRTTIVDLVPRLGRREVVLRTAVRFLTFAVWVPGAFVLVWPAIRSRFAR